MTGHFNTSSTCFRPGSSCGVYYNEENTLCTLYRRLHVLKWRSLKSNLQITLSPCPGFVTGRVLAPDDGFVHCSACMLKSSVILLLTMMALTLVYRS